MVDVDDDPMQDGHFALRRLKGKKERERRRGRGREDVLGGVGTPVKSLQVCVSARPLGRGGRSRGEQARHRMDQQPDQH